MIVGGWPSGSVEYRDLLDFLRTNLRLPTLAMVVAFNQSVRNDDEWFDEPDELETSRHFASAT